MTVQSRLKYKLAFKAKLVLEAVHSGPIADWKRALQNRAADVLGAAPCGGSTDLHAKIALTTLDENCAEQSRMAQHQSMIGRGHGMPPSRQTQLIHIRRGTVASPKVQ